jgi:hypothetical protein
MMDFDSILEQWENRKDRYSNSSGIGSRPESAETSPPADWLDSYLPDAGILAAKETDEKPPVSGGRSIWLRRDPQDVLDLHGLTGREAEEALRRFIGSMRNRGLRKGLIIHGKGLHSADGSVLAPLVRTFLEKSAEIGEFGRASRKDGGSGATWFILRQRSR